MISLAGGLDRDLGKEIIIFRPQKEGTQRIAVNLDKLVYEADPALNLAVLPGDIVYVPAVEKVRIFVTGAVKTPNLYEVPRSEPVTVLKAVTLVPATILGIANRVGSLEVGKDADVIILDGPPLSVKTWVERAYVNGELVHQR